jgi:hypothetical protein
MTDEKKPADPRPVTEDKNPSVHRITRRRFTKAGAIAPVVMTLGSRPVWGQGCETFSGALSGDLSNHQAAGKHDCIDGGQGASVADWLNSGDLLVPMIYEVDTTYSNKKEWKRNGVGEAKDVSTITLYGRQKFTIEWCNQSLAPLVALTSTATEDAPLIQQFAAAILNIKHYTASGYGYDERQVRDWICNKSWSSGRVSSYEVLDELNKRSKLVSFCTHDPYFKTIKFKGTSGPWSDPVRVVAAYECGSKWIVVIG